MCLSGLVCPAIRREFLVLDPALHPAREGAVRPTQESLGLLVALAGVLRLSIGCIPERAIESREE